MAINSQPYNGRPPCQHCGFCLFFMCEYGAKSTSMATMLPLAEATGRCEIRPGSYVARVETNDAGRATGVTYFDAKKQLQLQRAKAVVLCANGAETPRLLLNSESSRFPNGLANSSGAVGKYLMFNTYFGVNAQFEQPLNEFKSVQNTRMVHDFYETDPKRGFYGGGGIDARFDRYPISFALTGLAARHAGLGRGRSRRTLAEQFTRIDVLRHARHVAAGRDQQHLDRSGAEGRLGAAVHAGHLQGSPGRPEVRRVPRRARDRDRAGGRRAQDLAGAGPAADADRPPAGHVPHGQRPAHVGDRSLPSDARRAEPLHLRRQQHGDVVAGPADRDDFRAGVPRRRAHRRLREARRDLRLSSHSQISPT